MSAAGCVSESLSFNQCSVMLIASVHLVIVFCRILVVVVCQTIVQFRGSMSPKQLYTEIFFACWSMWTTGAAKWACFLENSVLFLCACGCWLCCVTDRCFVSRVADEMSQLCRDTSGQLVSDADHFSSWEQLINKNNIMVWRKPVPNSYLYEYKG